MDQFVSSEIVTRCDTGLLDAIIVHTGIDMNIARTGMFQKEHATKAQLSGEDARDMSTEYHIGLGTGIRASSSHESEPLFLCNDVTLRAEAYFGKPMR